MFPITIYPNPAKIATLNLILYDIVAINRAWDFGKTKYSAGLNRETDSGTGNDYTLSTSAVSTNSIRNSGENSNTQKEKFSRELPENNKPVLTVLELLPKDTDRQIILDEIKLVSAYERNNVQKTINDNHMRYLNSDRAITDTWLRANRLQLPSASTTYGVISKIEYPATNSIRNSEENSNTQKEKFSMEVPDEDALGKTKLS